MAKHLGRHLPPKRFTTLCVFLFSFPFKITCFFQFVVSGGWQAAAKVRRKRSLKNEPIYGFGVVNSKSIKTFSTETANVRNQFSIIRHGSITELCCWGPNTAGCLLKTLTDSFLPPM